MQARNNKAIIQFIGCQFTGPVNLYNNKNYVIDKIQRDKCNIEKEKLKLLVGENQNGNLRL